MIKYSEILDGEFTFRGWESRKATGAIGFLDLQIVWCVVVPGEISQSLLISNSPPRHGARTRQAPQTMFDNDNH